MLIVARALMAQPEVLLLDEVTEGLQPSLVDRLSDVLTRFRLDIGTSMIVIEQHLPFALGIASRYLVFKRGEIVATYQNAQPRQPERRAVRRVAIHGMELKLPLRRSEGKVTRYGEGLEATEHQGTAAVDVVLLIERTQFALGNAGFGAQAVRGALAAPERGFREREPAKQVVPVAVRHEQT